MARLLADPKRTETLANQIVTFVAANKLQGVTIDFEECAQGRTWNLENFLARLSAALRAA